MRNFTFLVLIMGSSVLGLESTTRSAADNSFPFDEVFYPLDHCFLMSDKSTFDYIVVGAGNSGF